MNPIWPAVALLTGVTTAVLMAMTGIRLAPARLLVSNYRGQRVPAVLGLALVVATAVAFVVAGWRAPWSRPGGGVLILLALGLAVGIIDDLAGGRVRGFRGHLGSLARGRLTTGILKLAAGVLIGVVAAVLMGGVVVRVIAAAVLIVVSINLWNTLDVVPGRALKWGVLALALVLGSGLGQPIGLLAAAGLGAALGVLPFDLAERGMLGDAGSNPLGFLAGYGLALVLPTWGVVVAAGVALALQVVAETVTISRLIDAVPLVRRFDRLGRKA